MSINERNEFMPDEIEKQKIYSAALDSAKYILDGKPSEMSDDDFNIGVKRNKVHLSFITSQYDFSGFDVSEINKAMGA